LDPIYAENLGVNIQDLLVCQPDSGEMALDVVDQLVRSAAVDIIVIDSVAALVPRAELEGDMTDMQMGLQARLMSKALRKITGSLSRSHTTVVFLNQLRSKIGIMYGNPEVTAGGNALKFYSSVRMDIRRKEVMKDNEGISVRVKVVKNKVNGVLSAELLSLVNLIVELLNRWLPRSGRLNLTSYLGLVSIRLVVYWMPRKLRELLIGKAHGIVAAICASLRAVDRLLTS
jgi:protein RecA